MGTSMSSDYSTVQDPSNEAGQMVYFKLEQVGSDMGQFLEDTVKSCQVIANGENVNGENVNYVLYDESETGVNQCGREEVSAQLEKVDSNYFTFEYLLFLFSGGSSNRSEYSLVCEVVLCMQDDVDSVCKKVEAEC